MSQNSYKFLISCLSLWCWCILTVMPFIHLLCNKDRRTEKRRNAWWFVFLLLWSGNKQNVTMAQRQHNIKQVVIMYMISLRLFHILTVMSLVLHLVACKSSTFPNLLSLNPQKTDQPFNRIHFITKIKFSY